MRASSARTRCGVRGPLAHRHGGRVPPSESSFRRFLRALPDGALARALSGWLAAQAAAGALDARRARRLAARLPAPASGGDRGGAVMSSGRGRPADGLRRRGRAAVKMLGSLPGHRLVLPAAGIAAIIDDAGPIRGVAAVTAGQAVEAMVCNRLTSPAPLVRVADWARTWAVPRVPRHRPGQPE